MSNFQQDLPQLVHSEGLLPQEPSTLGLGHAWRGLEEVEKCCRGGGEVKGPRRIRVEVEKGNKEEGKPRRRIGGDEERIENGEGEEGFKEKEKAYNHQGMACFTLKNRDECGNRTTCPTRVRMLE